MIVKIIKLCLEKMNKQFVNLSKLRFDEISGELKNILQEQKIQERPFVYEFYHQFRKMWDNEDIREILSEKVIIQAEVNKNYQGIPDLRKIPDILLHRPNTTENFAVIEFKLASNVAQIENDFKKLITFKRRLGYRYLIEILIGDKNSLRVARDRILSLDSPNGDEIILIEFNTDSWMANDSKIRYKE
jgi:hypothetical protein